MDGARVYKVWLRAARSAPRPQNISLTCEPDWRALCGNYLAQSVTGRASQVEAVVLRSHNFYIA